MQLLLGHIDDVCDEVLKAFELADYDKTGRLDKRRFALFIAQLKGRNIVAFCRAQSDQRRCVASGIETTHSGSSSLKSHDILCYQQQNQSANIVAFPVFFHAYCPVRFDNNAEQLFLAFRQRLLTTSFEVIDQPAEGFITIEKIIMAFKSFARELY